MRRCRAGQQMLYVLDRRDRSQARCSPSVCHRRLRRAPSVGCAPVQPRSRGPSSLPVSRVTGFACHLSIGHSRTFVLRVGSRVSCSCSSHPPCVCPIESARWGLDRSGCTRGVASSNTSCRKRTHDRYFTHGTTSVMRRCRALKGCHPMLQHVLVW